MRIHLIAIGGSIMHDLGIVLHKMGHQVSGSDDIIFEPSKSKLDSYGLLPQEMGWSEDRITDDIDFVILGMHAHEDNPELRKAQDLGLKIMSFPEFIYSQSKDKTRVVIGGSHGKTTVTAMVLHVMKYVGKGVDYLLGASLEGYEHNVSLSDDNDFIVIEGDEYLSSRIDPRPKFLHYHANIALINGIAWDHINVFPTEEVYLKAFEDFCESISEGGALIYNQEDKQATDIVEHCDKYLKTFGFGTPKYTYKEGEPFIETPLGEVPLQVYGVHNFQNMMAARSVCLQMNVTEEDFYEAMTTFSGADKRLQTLYKSDTLHIIKDFAHAPSKVKASVDAVVERFKGKHIVAISEIHTYSSLNKDFIPQYRGALDGVDAGVVFFEPANLEIKRLPKVSNEDIQAAFGNPNLSVANQKEQLEDFLKANLKPNSVLLFMSSGRLGGLDVLAYCQSLGI